MQLQPVLTQQAVAAIKKARVGGPCSDLEGLAVLAFNPARRFAPAGPGGSAGGVAVFGHANAGGLGLAGAEDVILGQTELLDEFAAVSYTHLTLPTILLV